MTGPLRDLSLRLSLVRRALATSPEPLHSPLGIIFRPEKGEDHVARWRAHAEAAREGRTFSPATLYVHVPFCARVCTYCLLSAVRTPGKEAVERYVRALRAQIDLYEPIVRGLPFGSIHVGGGTPTLLDERSLDALFTDLARLPRSETAQIGVEAHPATSTPGRLAVLRKHGVHRLSFGVETMTPLVLERVNRADQTEPRVRAAISEARKQGFSINIDLLSGLPGETLESWTATVKKTLSLAPDSLSVNRFLGEGSLLSSHGYAPTDAENKLADAMLLAADAMIREASPPRWPEEPLSRPGFGTQYVWDRSDSARGYFQEDMIGPVSTLAIGHGALGHVYGQGFSVPAGTIADYESRLGRGEPPDMLVCPTDERFEMAFFVADQAARGRLTRGLFSRIFKRDLGSVFREEVEFLIKASLLVEEGDALRKPARLDFQTAHLLAFLLRNGPSLAVEVRALEKATLEEEGSREVTIPLSEGDGPEAFFDRIPAETKAITIDVGSGVSGDLATRIAGLASEKGVRVTARGSAHRAIAEYSHVAEEVPPSMLWVRIAIRAAQASRGEQRLLRVRRPSPIGQQNEAQDDADPGAPRRQA